MNCDAIVPEEWVDAALAATGFRSRRMLGRNVRRSEMRLALEAVVPLAEQRATRNLLKARQETEGR